MYDTEGEFYKELIKIYQNYELTTKKDIDDVSKRAQKLNRELSHIQNLLEEYLQIQSEQAINPIPDIENLFDEIVKEKFDKKLCVNFNYTPTATKYNFPTAQIINIHGQLKAINNPIVFGYGDEIDDYYSKIERLNANEMLKGFKSFYNFKTSNYQTIVDFLYDEEYEVHIKGHSCGLSDRVLLSTIFQHPKCEKIKIYYHQRNEVENDFFEKTQEISRHFGPKYKATMRTKIVPFEQCVPLVKWV